MKMFMLIAQSDSCPDPERIFIARTHLSSNIASSDTYVAPQDIDSYLNMLSHNCEFVNIIATYSECISRCSKNGYCLAFSYATNGTCNMGLLTAVAIPSALPQDVYMDMAHLQSVLSGNVYHFRFYRQLIKLGNCNYFYSNLFYRAHVICLYIIEGLRATMC